MKKIGLMLTVALFCFGAMTTMQSCKNECKDVVCENAGTCNEDDGTCDCVTGYEGEFCADELRDKFEGTFLLSDDCDTQQYNSTISESSSAVDKVLISNFANVFVNSVEAHISSTTDIMIASQIPDNDDWSVSGSGTISGSTITMSYSVTDPNNVVTTCSTTWTKQ